MTSLKAQWVSVLLIQWSRKEFEISMELSFFKEVGKNRRGIEVYLSSEFFDIQRIFN
jgi:hypothetical protein